MFLYDCLIIFSHTKVDMDDWQVTPVNNIILIAVIVLVVVGIIILIVVIFNSGKTNASGSSNKQNKDQNNTNHDDNDDNDDFDSGAAVPPSIPNHRHTSKNTIKPISDLTVPKNTSGLVSQTLIQKQDQISPTVPVKGFVAAAPHQPPVQIAPAAPHVSVPHPDTSMIKIEPVPPVPQVAISTIIPTGTQVQQAQRILNQTHPRIAVSTIIPTGSAAQAQPISSIISADSTTQTQSIDSVVQTQSTESTAQSQSTSVVTSDTTLSTQCSTVESASAEVSSPEVFVQESAASRSSSSIGLSNESKESKEAQSSCPSEPSNIEEIARQQDLASVEDIIAKSDPETSGCSELEIDVSEISPIPSGHEPSRNPSDDDSCPSIPIDIPRPAILAPVKGPPYVPAHYGKSTNKLEDYINGHPRTIYETSGLSTDQSVADPASMSSDFSSQTEQSGRPVARKARSNPLNDLVNLGKNTGRGRGKNPRMGPLS